MAQLKTKNTLSEIESSDKNIFWVDNYLLGTEGPYGAYSTRRLTSSNLKQIICEKIMRRKITEELGTVIKFDTRKEYGSATVPESGTLSIDVTDAKKGLVQKIYHKNALGTIPGSWINVGGVYIAGTLNIIHAVFAGGTRVEYYVNNTFRPFILKVKSNASKQHTIPINAGIGVYNYSVVCSDGQYFSGITGNLTITFASALTDYTLEIRGVFPSIKYLLSPDNNYVLETIQWGDVVWSSLMQAYYMATNWFCSATDKPNLASGCSLYQAFINTNFNTDVRSWDWSKIVDGSAFAQGCPLYNQNTSDLDFTNLTALATPLTSSASFNNGGQRLRWDFQHKSINLGTYPFNATALNNFEFEFVNAENLTWGISLISSGLIRNQVKIIVIGGRNTSLDWSTGSTQYKNLTGEGVEEFLRKCDKTATSTLKLYVDVYNRLTTYVGTLGYGSVNLYLAATSNSWTVTM